MSYQAILTVHLLAVTLFGGSLLLTAALLPGLARSGQGTATHAELRRLRRWHGLVATPALLVLWIAGLTLAYRGGWFVAAWLHAKIALVLLVSALHGRQAGQLRRLAGGRSTPAVQARWPIALIAVTLTAIVLLASAKPAIL